ncbi:hypothetical protein EWM64_g316 [Hericium alpestre]|uniref:Uncharacterized protein n=1 Tax=Hericium alpestre TaxID=135208 RepID=A0A4Z0A9G9_9AGAM|nr:hypothetical protein EWM64_g316 [Hericium alpestre]
MSSPHGDNLILTVPRESENSLLGRDPPRLLHPQATAHHHGRRTLQANERRTRRARDLSALRDPQVAQIDQCFQRLSLWTIKKVLFVFNMERKLTLEEEQCGQGDAASAGLGGEDSSSGSEGDVTLVEEPGSLPSAKEDADAGVLTCEKERDNRAGLPAPSPAAWENSWQARWEVLTELVRRNQESLLTGAEDVAASLGLPHISGSLESPQADGTPATPPIKFFFADDGPGQGGEDGEAGDESEDDYGEVLMNPQFTRPFESGMELAREFLENDGMRIDVRSGAKMLCI